MSIHSEYHYSDDSDNYAHSYLREPVTQLLSSERQPVLDLGCGNGALGRHLLEKGLDLYGIDASLAGISIAKKHHPDRFFIQDLESKRLPEEIDNIAFKTIISTEVIEHLYDPQSFIEFCKSILLENGGGKLILTTPYHGYLKNLMLSLFNHWDFHHTPFWVGGHIKFWSKKTLTKLLEDNEFKVIRFEGCGRLPYLWKSMILVAEIDGNG